MHPLLRLSLPTMAALIAAPTAALVGYGDIETLPLALLLVAFLLPTLVIQPLARAKGWPRPTLIAALPWLITVVSLVVGALLAGGKTTDDGSADMIRFSAVVLIAAGAAALIVGELQGRKRR